MVTIHHQCKQRTLMRMRDLSIPTSLYNYTGRTKEKVLMLLLEQRLAQQTQQQSHPPPQKKRRTEMILRAFSTVASVSNDRRASTSVETYPGTILVISAPKFTATLSYKTNKKQVCK